MASLLGMIIVLPMRRREGPQRLRFSRLGVAVLGALLYGGCTHYSGGPALSILSQKNVTQFYEPYGKAVEVQECRHSFLLLGFFGNSAPSHAAVIDRALDEADADILMNADVVRISWTALLYGQVCTRVRGQPARRVRSQAGLRDAKGGERS